MESGSWDALSGASELEDKPCLLVLRERAGKRAHSSTHSPGSLAVAIVRMASPLHGHQGTTSHSSWVLPRKMVRRGRKLAFDSYTRGSCIVGPTVRHTAGTDRILTLPPPDNTPRRINAFFFSASAWRGGGLPRHAACDSSALRGRPQLFCLFDPFWTKISWCLAGTAQPLT